MKITREELYRMVWAEPMTSVCKKYGLSDNGLRKHCKAMNIPTPPAGYWSRLQNGKNPEIIPLPKQSLEGKQTTELNEQEVELNPPPDRTKLRELEIRNNDISVFVVPEVLYAKDPLIIDTIEKFRRESENTYLRKNPYKVKSGPTLNVFVSEKSLHRTLSIFETIIRGLRFRGGDIIIKDDHTYAVIKSEEIQISISEKHKQVPNSISDYPKYNSIHSGMLEVNIFFGYREQHTIRDTAYTKLEDKIISIIAYLEVRAEKIKEERIEEERRRKIRENEERLRREFEEKQKAEKKEFKSLFLMAERLHKTQILRNYIDTYEAFLKASGEIDDKAAAKIEWARSKADWLDPFICKDDKYLDFYNKNELIQPECPRKDSWNQFGYSDYHSAPENNFWTNQWWRKK